MKKRKKSRLRFPRRDDGFARRVSRGLSETGIMEVSRSFGDAALKRLCGRVMEDPSKNAIIAEPDTRVRISRVPPASAFTRRQTGTADSRVSLKDGVSTVRF